MNNFKKHFVALFLLLPFFSFAMQQDSNNNENNWDAIIRKKTAPLVKTKKQLSQESVKFRRYARQAAWEAKQEAIRKGKEDKEKVKKESFKNRKKDIVEDMANNIVIINDNPNHQTLYLLKRDQIVPVDQFKDMDRADYLIGEKLGAANGVVKADWSHNFNPMVQKFLKYGESNTVDVDGCHQYVIVGAIADNDNTNIFECGEFEYGVKKSLKDESLECYHHCFRTHDCQYLKQQDQDILEAYYTQKLEEQQKIDEPCDGKEDNTTDNSEKE